MKKKILIIAMSVIILAMTIASATTAYFIDTDSATNVFTVGKVEIDLNETCTDYTGKAIEPDASGVYDFGRLYPGQNYTKIANIKNVGTESAYLAAKITLTSKKLDALFLNADGSVNETALRSFLLGLVTTENNGYIVSFDAVANTDNTIIVRVIMTAATVNGDNFDLMTAVHVDPAWNNDTMDNLSDLNILVEAFGVQTVGFVSAEEAITTAFNTDFPASNP